MDTMNNTDQSNNKKTRQRRRSPADFLPQKTRLPVNILALAVVPYAAFLLLEMLFLGRIPFAGQIHLLNYILYLAFCLALVGLTGRLKTGVRIFLVTTWLIGCLNYAILATRMTPIMPWDVYAIPTAVSVAGNYGFPFTAAFFLYTALFAGLFFLTSFLTWKATKRPVHMTAFLIGTMILTGTVRFAMRPETKDEFGLDTTLFVTRHMAEMNGFVLNFVHSIHYLKVDAPPEYSVERVEEIEAAYADLLSDKPTSSRPGTQLASAADLGTDGAGATGGKESNSPLLGPSSPELTDLPEIARYLAIVNQKHSRALAPGETPDIVVIMNESFSDLRVLQDFETNIPVMPFFENVRQNTIKGVVHPSIIGGNTATSEFEFLTGSSMAFLPSGSSPYQQYVTGPTPSLVSLLEEQGYSSHAMHPYHSRGWMRHEVYPYFGFDQSTFIYDYKNNRKLRSYISDESAFQEIRRELAWPLNMHKPQFIFTVTMQNHGGYYGEHDNFDPKVKITSQEGTQALNNYLSLMNETDRALGEFLANLKVRERPTLVLFFGDHQPSDEVTAPLMAGQDDLTLSEKRRETPFLLWANYDLAGADGQKTSLNFLASRLLDGASLEYSPWHAFLKDVEAEVPAMNDAFYYTPDGRAESLSDADDRPQIMEDYEILQYNYLFDVPNRVDELFQMVRK